MQVHGRQFHFDKLFKDNTEGTAVNFSGITLYQLGDLSCLSGYQVPLHKQWCHEISYVISGEGLFTTNNETELLMRATFIFRPQALRTQFRPPVPTCGTVISALILTAPPMTRI